MLCGTLAFLILTVSLIGTISYESSRTLIVAPTFTSSAYQPHGFYSYYCDIQDLEIVVADDAKQAWCEKNYANETCNASCLNVPIFHKNDRRFSYLAVLFFQNWKYGTITDDVQLTLHPEMVNNYDRIIMLHNEYVSQAEFDAVTNHTHVIYLYPNSMFAKVAYNANNNTITLLTGHGYNGTWNAFHWKYENTQQELDNCSNGWVFKPLDNSGMQLSCYPETVIFSDQQLWLRILLDF